MPQTFIVDQAATFQAVAFLSAAPKIEYGTRDKQEMTKDGLPKWEVHRGLPGQLRQGQQRGSEGLLRGFEGPERVHRHVPAGPAGQFHRGRDREDRS
jgi:hypothetical protein